MMKRFELWLDESGDFDNDIQKVGNKANPSLVGGLLIENNTFSSSYINQILPEAGTYHSVDETDQLDRFKKIEERLFRNDANRIVVFSNQECIMILDNNLTYLNIISEGILQLIKRLKAQYGEIKLEVIIANRVDTTTGLNPAQSVVQTDEYIKRLKEKLLMGSLEHSISEEEWTLMTSSARKDKRLMLADIICNTYFTRHKKYKFNVSERAYIESIYNDGNKTLIFTVLESVLEKNFKSDLLENRIGEAVGTICLSQNEESLKRCFSLLESKFAACGIHDITFQYKFITAYIENYLNVVRDFGQCEILLNNLLKYYIPLLEKYKGTAADDYSKRLALDIKFYLLTNYTHTGNIVAADRMEKECEECMALLPPSLDTVNYKIKFENRKIINLMDAFDFERALEYADKQVKQCREVKELLELVSGDSNTYYDELAKALGTRLQIKTFLLRQNADLYESGKEDSDEAIGGFENFADKQRQYLYRVQLETEHGNYESALAFLKKATDVPEDAGIKELWEAIEKGNIFGANAFIRLMAESSGWKPAAEMYEVLSNNGFVQRLKDQTDVYHPVEIILWKYAYYCSKNGMENAAVKYYDKAKEICFSDNDFTLNLIGLGIAFEELSVLIAKKKKEQNDARKQVQKKWKKVQEKDYKQILPRVFGDVDFNNTDAGYFMALSRKITY